MTQSNAWRLSYRRVSGLAGATLVATTGLLGAYVGNPRLPRAYAASCTVTRLADSGKGTLRAALANPSCRIIKFRSGLRGKIVLRSDMPTVRRSVTIVGPGPARVTIDGRKKYRAFRLIDRTYRGTVTLVVSGLTLARNHSRGSGGAIGTIGANVKVTNTRFVDNSAGENGGAISAASATVTVLRSSFTRNKASGPYGGAIGSLYGYITATDSTFTANSGDLGGALGVTGGVVATGSTFTRNTAERGGAIGVNSGSVELTNSTLTENTAAASGGAVGTSDLADVTITDSTISGNSAGSGGGVSADGGDITFTGSTFSGNSARGSGGGANLGFVDTSVAVQNSTLSGNTAGESGGGIYLYSGNSMSLVFSTIASNGAPDGASIFGGSDASIRITGSVLTDPRGGGANCGGEEGANPVQRARFTIVANPAGDDVSCGVSATGAITLSTDAAVDLGPLSDNGGPTLTRMPGAGSVLLGAAPDALGTGVTVDQRGVTRSTPFTIGSVQPTPGS